MKCFHYETKSSQIKYSFQCIALVASIVLIAIVYSAPLDDVEMAPAIVPDAPEIQDYEFMKTDTGYMYS